jgi:hypothetical protein
VSRLFPGRGIPEIRRCCQCPAHETRYEPAPGRPRACQSAGIPQPSSSSGPLEVHIQVNASGSEQGFKSSEVFLSLSLPLY